MKRRGVRTMKMVGSFKMYIPAGFALREWQRKIIPVVLLSRPRRDSSTALCIIARCNLHEHLTLGCRVSVQIWSVYTQEQRFYRRTCEAHVRYVYDVCSSLGHMSKM